MTKMYLKLTEKYFRELVAGREIVKEAGDITTAVEVHMILEDMGFDRMAIAIGDVINDQTMESMK